MTVIPATKSPIGVKSSTHEQQVTVVTPGMELRNQRTAVTATSVVDNLTELPDAPAFLDDMGLSSILPTVPTVTNTRELFGRRPGETLVEALVRRRQEKYP